MKKLSVPYYSQWDSDATFSKDDCIPACASMLISYYGGILSTNKIAEKTGQGIVNFSEIERALKAFNYKIIGTSFRTIEDLKKSIDSGIPFIAIIHYGDIPNRQDTYTGPHAVVVVGYDDTNIYINDPDWWAPRRNEGECKVCPTTSFTKAWQSKVDGNNPGNLWYLDEELPIKGIGLAIDIPTEVEDAYDLKSKEWYDKHWNFGDFIKDSIKAHADCSEYKEELGDLKKNCELLKIAMNNDIAKFQNMTKQIETLQASNAENTAQLTVMGEQVKEANKQWGLAEASKNEIEESLRLTTVDLNAYKAEVAKLNTQLIRNLQGYSKWVRVKSLFNIY
jgi:hypothetical protein